MDGTDELARPDNLGTPGEGGVVQRPSPPWSIDLDREAVPRRAVRPNLRRGQGPPGQCRLSSIASSELERVWPGRVNPASKGQGIVVGRPMRHDGGVRSAQLCAGQPTAEIRRKIACHVASSGDSVGMTRLDWRRALSKTRVGPGLRAQRGRWVRSQSIGGGFPCSALAASQPSMGRRGGDRGCRRGACRNQRGVEHKESMQELHGALLREAESAILGLCDLIILRGGCPIFR
jgi:hypothetical protein